MSKAAQSLLISEQKSGADGWEMQEVLLDVTGQSSAGDALPPKYQVQAISIPEILHRLKGDLEDRRLSHVERQKKAGQPHLGIERGSSSVTDGPVQGQHVCSESIHCCWWEATPLPTHISCV